VLAALGLVIHVNSAIHVRDADNVRKAQPRNALHDLALKLVIGHRLILTRRADFSTRMRITSVRPSRATRYMIWRSSSSSVIVSYSPGVPTSARSTHLPVSIPFPLIAVFAALS
jgi:hypothetical protein